MKEFKFNVIDDAYNTVANWNGDGSWDAAISDVIRSLALINKNVNHLTRQKNYDAIVKYLRENSRPDKPFLDYMYMDTVYGIIDQIKKWGWYQIDPLKIRKSELDKIKMLGDVGKEKIVFAILVLCKYYDAKKKWDRHITYEDCDTICNLARISIKKQDRMDAMMFLNDTGLVKINAYLTYIFYECNFVSDDENDPIVMTIGETEMLELAYCYLNWHDGGGYKKCEKCGRLFRLSTSPGRVGKDEHVRRSNAKLCWVCAEQKDSRNPKIDKADFGDGYELFKVIKCVDCEKEIILEGGTANDKRTCRCQECQDKRNKELHAERMRRYRMRKKENENGDEQI